MPIDLNDEQLAGRVIAGPPYEGGFTAPAVPTARELRLTDIERVQTGKFGRMTLMQLIRLYGLPVEAEIYDGNPLDANIAAVTLLKDQRARVINFPEPPYYMDDPITFALVKDVILRSHTPGLSAPPTMVFENPQTMWSITGENVRFEGCWKLKYRNKPVTEVYAVNLSGAKNVTFDELVVENAKTALRMVNECENVRIRHLVTIDCDTALAIGDDCRQKGNAIERWTRIGSGNAATGHDNVSIGANEFLPFTPTLTFVTPGDLSVVYGTRTGEIERMGRQVSVGATLSVTPTFTTASGILRIGGLPIASRPGAIPFGLTLSSISETLWPVHATQIFPVIEPDTDYVELHVLRSKNERVRITAADIVSGQLLTIRFNGTYQGAL